MAFHLGLSYQPTPRWLITTEGIYPRTGLASFHLGGEWRPLKFIALRTGYRTDTIQGLSALAGCTVGLGMKVWGQELAYAWLPYGALGNTHYFSFLLKFGEVDRGRCNLIHYQQIHRTVHNGSNSEEDSPEYQQLMELLKEREKELARQQKGLDDPR